eukprot:CAMPEP_0182934310 /NCGR_PEP_ID=MMETSP0105_2-20130417/35871_1 /TAXON_ID=81532 ORGANISM="Acanthoeca-like sp., Strain 10tr" /NCGR_SAMPLE_ID=MMETSP0105_2 /ASSEMBLY_ACC=CAM_ASM_000205 /LENGTH=235 /DNA_ID=CAMNT_0025073147 /DNA_START=22 /DNA_END=726 /DNA_ORIENTATION=-
MAGAAAADGGAAGVAIDDFVPAITVYTPTRPAVPIDEIPAETFKRGATVDKLKELAERFPDIPAFDLLRFLKARDGDVTKASQMVTDHVTWREGRTPVDVELVKARFCYCSKGRDKEGNALVVYDGSRHSADADLDHVVGAIVNALAQAIDRSLSTERKVTLIAFTVSGTPKGHGMWRKIIGQLSDNQPETLAKVLVFPVDAFGWVLWKTVSLFMDKETAKKVKLLKGGRHPTDV